MIGVVAESVAGETRVAATPQTVSRLISLGYSVLVEAGGRPGGASFTDEAYIEAGASIGTKHEAWGSEIVLAVKPTNRGRDRPGSKRPRP